MSSINLTSCGTNQNLLLYTPTHRMVFGPDAIMVIDKDGMIYKGQRIEDGGEAYRALMEMTGVVRKWKQLGCALDAK